MRTLYIAAACVLLAAPAAHASSIIDSFVGAESLRYPTTGDTTGGIAGEDVRDPMVSAVESRFGQVKRLPVTIEWLSDNGSCYVAGDTRSFAREIGLEPRTTPL
jgi:transposase InsO family protein